MESKLEEIIKMKQLECQPKFQDDYNVQTKERMQLFNCKALGLKPMFEDLKQDKISVKKQNEEEDENTERNDSSLFKEYNRTEIPEDHPIIYMKSLDTSLSTDFSSAEGQKIFKRAIQRNFMKSYFTLAPHFDTQIEPNFCGIGTLKMVLNALQVDPRRMWKYPWRWYDEYMLNTCISLDLMMEKGCDFDELACMMRCNKLSVIAVRASQRSSIKMFREDVLRATSSCDTVMILNYNRGSFNQTGTGHFSPLAGYDKKTDKVLILDTARFKLPPHWVQLELLWQSQKEIAVTRYGASDDMPRGYYLVKKNELNPTITLKLTRHLEIFLQPSKIDTDEATSLWKYTIDKWQQWLDQEQHSSGDIIQNATKQLLHLLQLLPLDEKYPPLLKSLTTIVELYWELKTTETFQEVRNYIEKHSKQEAEKICSRLIGTVLLKPKTIFNIGGILAKRDTSLKLLDVLTAVITTLLVLWPYRADTSKSNRKLLEDNILRDIRLLSPQLVKFAHEHIRFIVKTIGHFRHEKIFCKEEHFFD